MRRLNSVGCICPVLCILLSICAGIETINGKVKIPAFFTFVDSIVDPGNNNFIPTIAKANHAPYGQDFMGHEQNGRFSNGKLPTNFMHFSQTSGLGVKEKIPPFLDPNLNSHELLTGVSFASAGSGFDNLTSALFNSIPMWKQVELFKTYKARLENLVGKENSSNIIGEAIFLVVAGTNDFLLNYPFLPIRRTQFIVQQYQEFVLEICSSFIQVKQISLRWIIPVEKTLHGESKLNGCIEAINNISSSYNKKLKETLQELEARLPGIKLEYADIYENLLDMKKNPFLYGFEISDRGCCGTGLLEVGPLCHVKTLITCSNTSKSVFWDSAHPTQATYQIIADKLLRQYSKAALRNNQNIYFQSAINLCAIV
ncbi:GDSL esterase/lipase At2g42990 [Cryptomeria japonica]|uniref:GDSL esterase/lipase At2g42990 n=1 Tax=Cryptomeria japonica TaxID=3369 RepID=UPI0027DA58F4|nr:GDSL esterase/lipase At2g42990 [Cryptomeria japonica]